MKHSLRLTSQPPFQKINPRMNFATLLTIQPFQKVRSSSDLFTTMESFPSTPSTSIISPWAEKMNCVSSNATPLDSHEDHLEPSSSVNLKKRVRSESILQNLKKRRNPNTHFEEWLQKHRGHNTLRQVSMTTSDEEDEEAENPPLKKRLLHDIEEEEEEDDVEDLEATSEEEEEEEEEEEDDLPGLIAVEDGEEEHDRIAVNFITTDPLHPENLADMSAMMIKSYNEEIQRLITEGKYAYAAEIANRLDASVDKLRRCMVNWSYNVASNRKRN